MKNDRRFSRAWRRHHRARLKKGRASYWSLTNRAFPPEANAHARMLGMLVHTPASCSCWMCGNPRRFQGEPTRQELLASQAWRLDDPIGEAALRP